MLKRWFELEVFGVAVGTIAVKISSFVFHVLAMH